MNYFTTKELSYSYIAVQRGIDNNPPEDIKHHLEDLIDKLLNPLREAWGSPILITSGYRCPELNKMVGGSESSAHLTGFAADIVPQNGDYEGFEQFLRETLCNLPFDQCIFENTRDIKWVHLSLYGLKMKQRRQIIYITK
jgi:hypothetical protein